MSFGIFFLAKSATIAPTGSNLKWSLASSWKDGIKPQAGDEVTIPEGRSMILDQDVDVKYISVLGSLVVDVTKNINIRTEFIMVMGSSALFQWGTEANPYLMKGVITLVGNNPAATIPMHGGASKAIIVMDGAKLELHGQKKTSWTSLASSTSRSAPKITISSNQTNWEKGDVILISPSRFSENEGEKRIITDVSADNKVFTLDKPLDFPHIGTTKTYTRAKDGKTWTADMRAEVGLLSKNIKIQGDDFSETNGYGGHIMIMSNGIAHVENVELFRMGQKSVLGSYPFHWHLLQEKGAGQYFKNNSVHISYNRAITIHGTESTLVENNFFYDHIGHGVFLENGSERFNVIRGNVVLLTRRPLAGEELTPSDNELNIVQNRSPASFWITNPNNIFENNVAAGTDGTGYWFIMPRSPLAPSSGIPRFAGLQPFREPLGLFKGNKAHSCTSGLDIFDQLSGKHSIIANMAWERTDRRLLDQSTWYACDVATYGGLGQGKEFTEGVIFHDNVYVDNEISQWEANYSGSEQSVFVARSGEKALEGGERSVLRPYDGPCFFKDCHFVGWNTGTNSFLRDQGGAALKHVNYKISGATMDPVGSVNFVLDDFTQIVKGSYGLSHWSQPAQWNFVMWDSDGTFSGKKNTSVVTSHPLMRDGSEQRFANWTNTYRTDRRFALMRIISDKILMSLTRTKAGTPKAGQYYFNGLHDDFIQFPVMVNDDFLYTMQFDYPSFGTDKQVKILMDDYDIAGNDVLYRLKDFGRLTGIDVTGATKYTSLSLLNSANNTGFAIVGNDLYLKMVAVVGDPTISCTVSWTEINFTFPVLDTDGDGISDANEVNAGTDPIPNDPVRQNPILSQSLVTANSEVILEEEKVERFIFPNPSNDGIFNLSESDVWKVTSITGKELKAGNGNLIDLSSYPKGVYLIKINDKVERVVVE